MFIFLIALLSFLSVIGFVELLRKFNFWLFRPECKQVYIGATLTTADDAEMTVRSLMQRIRWMNLGVPVRLILVDHSQDPQLRAIVEHLIWRFPEATLLSSEKTDFPQKK